MSSSSSSSAPQTLSILIPCYNEIATIAELLRRVRSVEIPLRKEIIVVDDGSTDGTRELLRGALAPLVDQVIFHESNRGRGVALRTAMEHAQGDIMILQDADLECDPAEYPQLLAPILEHAADVVYSSRMKGVGMRSISYFWTALANHCFSFGVSLITNRWFSDVFSCYRLFRREVMLSLKLQERSYAVDTELGIQIGRGPWKIYEVGISYHFRSYAEGKKIGFRDALRGLYVILKYTLWKR